jgi:hypothetical protein
MGGNFEACVVSGRVLLVLTALMIFVMPMDRVLLAF